MADEKAPSEQAPQAAAPAAAAPAGEQKSKKISRMTLAEVESQIKNVKEKMGDFQSSFARHLLARQKELKEQASPKK